MSDLRISYSELETTRAVMAHLVTEFETLQAGQSAQDQALGYSGMTGAMDAFYGNWAYHRRQLQQKMVSLDTMVGEALTQFPRTDQRLSRTLKKLLS
jgi:hypothetical protein